MISGFVWEPKLLESGVVAWFGVEGSGFKVWVSQFSSFMVVVLGY